MMLTLTNFKQIIPSQILTRGREYYRNGSVADLTLDDEDLWVAQVMGSEPYEVQIEQKRGELICSCTCPYDMGDHCKHIAAVLYAIEESYPEYFGEKKPRKPGKKKETRADKLQNALKKATEAEMRAFLGELAMQDRNIYNQIILKFGSEQSRENYERMVKDALRAGRGEYGMIDYRGATMAAKRLEELLKRADELLEQGEADTALLVYQVVIENVIEAMENADDSSGALGGCISLAIAHLEECAAQLDNTGKHSLFVYCLDQAQKRRLSGFDWRWELLDIAARATATPEDRTLLFGALDEIDSEASTISMRGFVSTFNMERTAQVRLKVIERMEGTQVANEFIESHSHLRRFKQIIVDRHIENKEFEQAKKIINAAVADAEKERLPGLAASYRGSLLEIAKRENDIPTIIKLAQEFLLERGNEEYYMLLKKTVPAKDWSAYLESLLRQVRDRYFAAEFSAWVFTKEEMWDRLLELVKPENIRLIEHYRAQLEKRFPDAMAAHYETFCLYTVEHNSNRDGYRQAVEYLRRMKKLGHAIRANETIKLLRGVYPKRRALLDELDQL